MTDYLIGQSAVQISTAIILVLSAVLALFLTRNYFQRRSSSYLFWSIGMWLFAMGVMEEFLFASGIYGTQLVKSYLGIVALLVQFLALGSIQLVQSRMVKRTYYLFALIVTLALSYLLLDANIGNVLTDYVVYGELPVTVVVISSVITFPAAAVLIWTAVRTFRRDKNRKMLSIVAGVVVVSIAGSLYIVQFPSFLYVSEFIGILLLWVGFFDFSSRKKIVSSEEELRQQRLR